LLAAMAQITNLRQRGAIFGKKGMNYPAAEQRGIA